MKEWITPYIKHYKGRISLNILFAVLGIGSGAMLLFVSGFLISKTSLQPENILVVFIPIVAVRAFSITQAVFPYLEKLVGHDVVLRILAAYRDKLYDIIEPQALALSSRHQTGDILGVVADDVEKLQDFYIRTIFPAVTSIVVYTVIVAVFGVFDLAFMLLVLALLGVIVFLMPLFSYWIMKRHHLSIKEKRGTLYQEMTDALFGQIDWMLSGRTSELFQRVQQHNHDLISRQNRVHRFHHVRDVLLRFVSGLLIVATMFWADSQVDDGQITATVIAAFVLMMFSVADALFPTSDALEEMPAYMDSIKRMHELADTSLDDSGETETPDVTDHPGMELRQVHYRYHPGEDDVLNGLDWTIEPGQKIALLGKSGSGKSTLLKLLAGVLKPDSGNVLLDGTDMHAGHLAQNVSVLNQHPHLFNTTIAGNIRLARPGVTDEAIIDVLESAQMMDLIRTLPQGIHTQMEEMGDRFSGGEKHRIAFARILIQDTPIVLLDEPTTGLDPVTENQLLTTMLEAAHDKTVILVTHHLAGAELMDHIVFLEKGGIKLSGSHTTLLQASEYYRTLYEMDQGYQTG